MSSPITHLTDFSDKLSPMLVKELRQGMRARSFTLLFLVFQLLLCFILLTAGSSAGFSEAGTTASSVIFTMFGIAVLFIQPMRGVSALSSEISGNTIEMMALTRLSAARIVFGKWIAIVSQSALILITIIPYLILRYFFGGMLLLGELVFLALMFMTSMALTAVMVGLSGNASKLARLLPTIGLIFLFSALSGFFRSGRGSFGLIETCTLSDWESRIAILCYISFIAYIGWCALSYGISSIAPVAENHSTLRRLIALALALIAAAVGLHNDVPTLALFPIFAIIIAPAIITAVTEPAILLPPICKPFVKRGALGKLASIFLLPGWPAGVFYTVILAAITFCGIFVSEKLHHSSGAYRPEINEDIIIPTLACFTGVIFPALLAAHFTKSEGKRFSNFLIFVLISVTLTFVPTMILNINHSQSLLWLFAWNPPVWIAMISDSYFKDSNVLIAAITVSAIYMGLFIISAIIAFRRYREVMQEAEDELHKTTIISAT
jgi:hypothetical protein